MDLGKGRAQSSLRVVLDARRPISGTVSSPYKVRISGLDLRRRILAWATTETWARWLIFGYAVSDHTVHLAWAGDVRRIVLHTSGESPDCPQWEPARPGDFLDLRRYALHDRDTKFCPLFRAT